MYSARVGHLTTRTHGSCVCSMSRAKPCSSATQHCRTRDACCDGTAHDHGKQCARFRQWPLHSQLHFQGVTPPDSNCAVQLFLLPFMRHWGLASARPAPSIEQMATLRLQDFVQPCPVKHGDTLQAIALREGSSEMDLRILNNLLSERAVSAYESVFVPVAKPEQLQGKHLRLQRVGAMQRVLPVGPASCGMGAVCHECPFCRWD
jgi:hypothetical protein